MIPRCSGFYLCISSRVWVTCGCMKNKESRRIVPVSAFVLVLLVILVVCEALVIGGSLEVKASSIAKVAPWAYEPFLRLVGEHPDSPRYHENDGKQN